MGKQQQGAANPRNNCAPVPDLEAAVRNSSGALGRTSTSEKTQEHLREMRSQVKHQVNRNGTSDVIQTKPE